ncbi:Pr6Pr family membrane protein [Aeromicrobium endophyticum]|uniref:F420-dependent oxidoreductase n=1 Tax=Aeromicrobium endophyticum TaxID=2292704 RepID=A0A371PBI5_9ACTN|nr:Pr6Pr family membrane protein [Aeromicrobium endophyticum]REK72936.1 F420-dependent oxidoreductase [Aeromicrobium endophyticum]
MTRTWHGLIALLVAIALVGQTAITVDDGRSLVNFFSYFTIESNILVLVASVLLVLRPDRGGTAFGILRLGSLTAITVTGVVYATLLAGNAEFEGAEWWYDKIFHYVVPVMTVIGFVALRPRTRLERTALWSLAFPVAWLAYTLVRAEVADPVYALTPTTTAPVPYGFLDVADLGWLTVSSICLVMTAGFVALSVFYARISRSRPARR